MAKAAKKKPSRPAAKKSSNARRRWTPEEDRRLSDHFPLTGASPATDGASLKALAKELGRAPSAVKGRWLALSAKYGGRGRFQRRPLHCPEEPKPDVDFSGFLAQVSNLSVDNREMRKALAEIDEHVTAIVGVLDRIRPAVEKNGDAG